MTGLEWITLKEWFDTLEGVQFHPESIITQVGKDLLRNFLKLPYTRGNNLEVTR